MTPKPAVSEKVFRDNVHGYIRIPTVIVDEIIDTEMFQRLRHIEQTSMRPLFPAARHDRFIHSLGVFYLGNRAFKAIRETLPQDLRESLPGECGKEGWWDKRHYLFTLACLLHDCAHAPFSHTLEKYYGLERSESGDRSRLDDEVIKEYGHCEGFEKDFLAGGMKGRGAEHEKMSSLVVGRYFRARIKRVFDHLREIRCLPKEFSVVSENDIALMARMIIGCPYSEELDAEKSLDNCFISLLNSSSIDVDGLDYTMRDTQSSGIDNWDIDYERLLTSLKIRSATRLSGCAVSNVSLEGIWLESTVFESVKASRTLKPRLEIRGSFEGTIDDGSDMESFLNLKGPQSCLGGNAVRISGDRERTVFEGMRQGYRVKTNSSCKIALSEWSGMIAGTVLLPTNRVQKECHLNGGFEQSYVLTYEKSSISVISGAIEARNSFYRWVYSHPHIQYHSSFLQNYLLKMSAKYLCCKKNNPLFSSESGGCCPPSHCDASTCLALREGRECLGEEDAIFLILGLNGFYDPECHAEKSDLGEGLLFCRSTDDDLNALFKWVYLDNKHGPAGLRNEAIEKYFGEYFSRTRKSLLWKSPEDRRHFIGRHPDCPDFAFSDLKGAENSLLSLDYVFVDANDSKAHFFFRNGCENLLAINVSQKMKGLDFASTFISFDGDVERMIDIMEPSSVSPSAKKFLYLFSDTPFDEVDEN